MEGASSGRAAIVRDAAHQRWRSYVVTRAVSSPVVDGAVAKPGVGQVRTLVGEPGSRLFVDIDTQAWFVARVE
jgi:hypothetical protein